MTETPRLPFPEVEHLRPVDYTPELTLAERAARFHAENPHVLTLVITLARRVVDRGRGRGSINMIFETLRWHYLETHGDIYALNNSYRAWYAREAMRVDPTLAGFFTTREGPHDADYQDRHASAPAGTTPTIHLMPPSADRGDKRSLTPAGFARAVFDVNHPRVKGTERHATTRQA